MSRAQPPAQIRDTYKTRPGCSVFYPVGSLKSLPGWRWHSLSGQPAPMPDCPHAENIFPLFKSEPRCFNFSVCLIKINVVLIYNYYLYELMLCNDAGLFTQLCPQNLRGR